MKRNQIHISSGTKSLNFETTYHGVGVGLTEIEAQGQLDPFSKLTVSQSHK